MNNPRRQRRRERAARILFATNLGGLIVSAGYAGAVLPRHAPMLAGLGCLSFFLGLLVPALKEFLHLRRDYDGVEATFLRRHGSGPRPYQEVFGRSDNVLTDTVTIPVMLAFWFALLGVGLVAADAVGG